MTISLTSRYDGLLSIHARLDQSLWLDRCMLSMHHTSSWPTGTSYGGTMNPWWVPLSKWTRNTIPSSQASLSNHSQPATFMVDSPSSTFELGLAECLACSWVMQIAVVARVHCLKTVGTGRTYGHLSDTTLCPGNHHLYLRFAMCIL